MHNIKKRYFPCPYCKGRGGYTEVILDDGTGPYEPCYACDDKRMVEIGGEVHRKWKAEHIALEIINFVKPSKDEWSMAELFELGNKALDLIKEPSSA